MTGLLHSVCLVRTSVAFIVATFASAMIRPLEAQDISGQPITILVGQPAGGATDVIARLLAQRIGEGLHTRVDVENRPADASMPVLRELAAAPVDGHTLLFMSTSMLIAQALHRDYPFDLTTLTAVTEVAAGPLILTTRNSFPV